MRHILFIYFMFSVISAFSQNTQISPGVLWNDINGEQINAHGGCVVFENGFYYWFGEDRSYFAPEIYLQSYIWCNQQYPGSVSNI